MNKSIKPLYASPRPGDVRHSLAEIGKARKLLNYDPQVNVATGIKKSIEWFSHHFQE
jgi:nucleoside-diphosphate-sugar epimerase